MTALPLPFRSNSGKYNFLGTPKLLNAYIEKQGPDAKAETAILPSAGLTLLVEAADTPWRGFVYMEDLDVIYTVHSSGVYKVTRALVVTRVGTIPGTDIVQISRNQADPVQVSIHCDRGEFYIEADVVKRVTDDGLPDDIVTQDHANGITIYGGENGEAWPSQINDCADIDTTDQFTAESSADKLTRIKVDGGDAYLFGERTIEPWRLTGEVGFEPVGRAIQKGLVAPHGVVSADNTLMFPGEDNVYYRLSGHNPVRISTHDQERTLEADTDRSAVLGFPITFEGHTFANWIGTNWSKTFDAATQQWHDRESFGSSRWRARGALRAWGKTIVGDSLSGKLFYLDKDSFLEDDQPLIWGGDSPTLHAFPNGGICDAVSFDFATGFGKTTSTEQGFDPLAMLEISTDGGNTWKAHRQLKLGKRGQRIRVTARRLGRFGTLGMVFRWRISDPVVRALVNIDVAVRPLKK